MSRGGVALAAIATEIEQHELELAKLRAAAQLTGEVFGLEVPERLVDVEAIEEPAPAELPAGSEEPQQPSDEPLHREEPPPPRPARAPQRAKRAVKSTRRTADELDELVLGLLADGPRTATHIRAKLGSPSTTYRVLDRLVGAGKVLRPSGRGEPYRLADQLRPPEPPEPAEEPSPTPSPPPAPLPPSRIPEQVEDDLSDLRETANPAQLNTRRRVMLALRDGPLSIPELIRGLMEQGTTGDEGKADAIRAVSDLCSSGEVMKHPKFPGEPHARYGLTAEGEHQLDAEARAA